MATVESPKDWTENAQPMRDEWVARLSELVDTTRGWAEELGWATRRIEKKMKESQLGAYQAPALLLQAATTKLILEPIARTVSGAEGAVDLYLMPAWDDIACLLYYDGDWQLHYPFPGSSAAATIRETDHKPLSKETFGEVLQELIKNVSCATGLV